MDADWKYGSISRLKDWKFRGGCRLKNKKIVPAALLSAIMLISSVSNASPLESFNDISEGEHWAEDSLIHLIQHDILRGKGGRLDADGNLTRAEIAAMINRMFENEERENIERFTDVEESVWYYEDIAKAVGMGILEGKPGGKMEPDSEITRQDTAAVLYRLISLKESDTSVLDSYKDGNEVWDYARPAFSALIERGIFKGYEGRLNPQDPITRAEFAAVLHRMFPNIIRTEADFENIKDGNVLVGGDVELIKDLEVSGDIILADGLGDRRITMDNVRSERLIVRGGETEEVNMETDMERVMLRRNRTNEEEKEHTENSEIHEDIALEPLFKEPSYSSEILYGLLPQEKEFLGYDGEWRHVRISDGTEGYLPPEGIEYKMYDSSVMIDIPAASQLPEYQNGCEAVAVKMMMEGLGINKSKHELIAEMPRDMKEPVYRNGRIYIWGNPHKGFVGYYEGGNRIGYSIYPEAVTEYLKQYFDKPKNLSRTDTATLERYIRAGRPVVVWVIEDFGEIERWLTWYTEDGEEIPATFEIHAMTLVGFDENNYYLNDPYTGTKNYKVSKKRFSEVWEQLAYMAVAVD